MTILTFIMTILFIIGPSAYFIFYEQTHWFFSFIFLALSPLAFYFFFLLFFGIFLFTLLFVKKQGSLYTYRGIKSILNFLRRFLFYHHLGTLNNPPKIRKDQKIVVMANHKAKFDPLFLIQKVPFNLAFTPKSDLYKNKVLQFVLNKLGCVPIYRDDIRKTIISLNIMYKHINEDNIRYMIFPEGGTHNREHEYLYNQKDAAYKVIHETKCDILPIRIYNNLDFTPFSKKRITLKYLKVIPYDEIKDLSTREIAQVVEKEFLNY